MNRSNRTTLLSQKMSLPLNLRLSQMMDPPNEDCPAVGTQPSTNAQPNTLTERTPIAPIAKVRERASGSGRAKSRAWDHFDKLKGEDGKTRAICKYCQKEYLADSKGHGTSNLLSHSANCQKYPYRELERGQQTLSFQPKKDGEEGVDLEAMSFNEEASRKALAEMIILDELPFRFVDGIGFKRFCNVLQPKFKTIPSRITIAKDVAVIFNKERDSLRKTLKGRRVCLTTDTWTSIQNINYMCLAVHFIDDDWKLQKRIINFCQVEDHKGGTIGKRIEMCLLEWNIDSIFTLTVDNASSNNTIIKFLKNKTKTWKGTIFGHEFLHMRCCAHILNLIVGDSLIELDTSIGSIRDAVRYVRSSPNRLENFKKCVEKEKIESKSLLCLDVPTRWNSTYLMLEAAEKFEKAFDRLLEEDSNYQSYFVDDEVCEGGDEGSGTGKKTRGPPTKDDWNKCRMFVKFLRLFYHATRRFLGSLYVTSNCLFDEMFVIQTKIRQLVKKDSKEDQLLSSMAKSMKEKFDKYWGNGDKINLLVYVAVVLDPRKKLKYVKFCFSQLFGAGVVNEMTGRVKDCLTRLYEYYGAHDSTSVEVPNVSEASEMMIDDDCDDPHLLVASQFNSYLEEEDSILCKSEVDKYLAESCVGSIDENFDILGWWKTNSSKYRVLSQVAHDVLAIPVSTIASDSAFSVGGRILDPFRSSLSPMMVEVLICAQNWLQSTIPISLRKAMDDVEQYEQYNSAFSSSSSSPSLGPS
ncbi:unnamed protein product [Camellia sinensis]